MLVMTLDKYDTIENIEYEMMNAITKFITF